MYKPKGVGIQYFFTSKDQQLPDKWNLLRGFAKKELSLDAQLKLEWIIFYYTVSSENAKVTANHFGISRKTVHKWLGRFDEVNLKTLDSYGILMPLSSGGMAKGELYSQP